MSIATSRVFKACTALLAPARSLAAEATASKPASTAAGKTKAKPKLRSTTPIKPTGILKAMPVSPALRNFLGTPESSRSEAVKKIWDHIKLHKLQNPENKKEIFCDQKLKTIFDGKDKVGMMEIAKLLSSHFVKTG